MGIPNFNKYLKTIDKTICPNERGIMKVHLSKYRGKKVAIDTCIFIYQSLYSHPEGHIQGMLNLIAKLKIHDIIPIFVFDGKPPNSKANVINVRRKNRQRIKNKIETLEKKLTRQDSDGLLEIPDELTSSSSSTDSNFSMISSISSNDDSISSESPDYEPNEEEIVQKIQKLSKKCVEIKSFHIDELKKFFDMININYIHLKEYEADMVCSQLLKDGYADAVISNDMDLLAYNCPIVLRGLDFKSEFVLEYNVSAIRDNMELTDSQLTDLCIMMGCDYSKRLFSHANCHDYHILLRQYDNIEAIINAYNDNDINISHMNQAFEYEPARDIFSKNIDIESSMINNYMNKSSYNYNLSYKSAKSNRNYRETFNSNNTSNSYRNFGYIDNYLTTDRFNGDRFNGDCVNGDRFNGDCVNGECNYCVINRQNVLNFLDKKCPNLRKKLITNKLDTILKSFNRKKIECY